MTRAQAQGTVAIIFTAQRTDEDETVYTEAAARMSALAAEQPGYRGERHVRDSDGLGITVSYWVDEASALAWRDHPDHAAIRERGRDRCYMHYTLEVAIIERSYDWSR